ncbi:MAG TPA: hypothetical protein VGH87_11660, partial [Polyangiaceae bacterium]
MHDDIAIGRAADRDRVAPETAHSAARVARAASSPLLLLGVVPTGSFVNCVGRSHLFADVRVRILR